MERNSNNGIVPITATSSYRSNRHRFWHRPGFMEPLGGGYVRHRYEQEGGGSGGSGGSGIMEMVSRRRRELLRFDGDISFSACCLLVVMIVMMIGLVVVWGGFRFASSETYDAV